MNDSHPACLDPLLVARLMCTRLCHDLAAPIGAVSNGAELMGADPSMIDAEMLGLLTDSAAAASLRLRTLRAAFGLGGAVDAADVPRLLSGWVAARTIVTLPDSVVLSRLTGEVLQILLNMALVAYDAALAPRSLVVSVAAEGETVITAEADGRGARREAGLAEAIIGAAASDALGPRTIQGWLVGALTRARGGRVEYGETPTGARVVATLPELTI